MAILAGPRLPNTPLRGWTLVQGLAVLLACTASFASAQTATVRIDASKVENQVSPRMNAAFVEMMAEDVKRGLTAEMLHDRSFEEPADYLGLPAEWRLEPDERNDNVGAIRFAPSNDAYPATNAATGAPEHGLRVTLTPQDIADDRRGFSQGRLSIRAGQRYSGYVWIKIPEKDGYAGTITAALEQDVTGGSTYVSAELAAAKGEWRKYSFSLTPATTDRFAKLTFLFQGRGVLLMDQASLLPSDAANGVRSDSAGMIGQLHPSFLRWPGGNVAQDYHWRWGVGPRDTRPVWINKAWSNAPEPNDFGTDEYLAFCTRMHIEPSITVNVNGNGATAEEAAAWVEYVNGPATSKYGSMRAANGHPAPYGVKQWELGNEIFGNWVRGHVDAETYAHSAVEYARAMRAVDPSLRLIAVGQGLGKDRDAWNAAVLTIAGSVIDDLAIHDYTTLSQNATATPWVTLMQRPAEFEAGYRETGKQIERLAPGRHIHLIVNEWNLFYPASTIQSMDGAVYAARMMNGFERDGDIVEAHCISDLLNGWVGGVIQADRDRVYGTAQFYALKMYSEHMGSERLSTVTSSPELGSGVKAMDAIATRSKDRSKIYVTMSNADSIRAIRVMVSVGAAAHKTAVQSVTLAAAKTADRNRFDSPHTLHPVETVLHCEEECIILLPPKAVSVLTFEVAAARQRR